VPEDPSCTEHGYVCDAAVTDGIQFDATAPQCQTAADNRIRLCANEFGLARRRRTPHKAPRQCRGAMPPMSCSLTIFGFLQCPQSRWPDSSSRLISAACRDRVDLPQVREMELRRQSTDTTHAAIRSRQPVRAGWYSGRQRWSCDARCHDHRHQLRLFWRRHAVEYLAHTVGSRVRSNLEVVRQCQLPACQFLRGVNAAPAHIMAIRLPTGLGSAAMTASRSAPTRMRSGFDLNTSSDAVPTQGLVPLPDEAYDSRR